MARRDRRLKWLEHRAGGTALVATLLLTSCGTGGGVVSGDDVGCRPARPERIAPYSRAVHNLIDFPRHPQPDTDGDERDDTISQGGDGALVLSRGDGVLRLLEPGHEVFIQQWADLDGDGRDDVSVSVGLPSGPPAVYLVNGTTAPGTHTLHAVGIRIDEDHTFASYQDLDGRPGVDLLASFVDGGTAYTDVYSGAEVLSRGPGADARGTPPVRRLVGSVAGVAPLAQGAEPETLLLVRSPQPAVRFASRPAAILQAPFVPAHPVPDLFPFMNLFVFEEGGVRKIGLQVDRQIAIWPVPPACPA